MPPPRPPLWAVIAFMVFCMVLSLIFSLGGPYIAHLIRGQ
jgi:hypothetical protein